MILFPGIEHRDLQHCGSNKFSQLHSKLNVIDLHDNPAEFNRIKIFSCHPEHNRQAAEVGLYIMFHLFEYQ